jgi:hypothetical protein
MIIETIVHSHSKTRDYKLHRIDSTTFVHHLSPEIIPAIHEPINSEADQRAYE